MAITLVGTTTAGAIDGADATLDLTAIAGLAENDVVLVFGAVPRLSAGGTSSTDWVPLETLDQTIIRGTVWRKVMGATPDTSFVLTGTANVADGTIAHARAYRGVDTATPEDAATTEAAGNSTNPDPPAITTVTNGAMVVAFGASQNNDASITAPSGYGNAVQSVQVDTRPVTMGSADLTKATAGAEDPASWTTWITANWVTFTVALRPSSGNKTLAVDAGSFALTGSTASLEYGREVVADAGSFALAGSAASLEFGREIEADAGAFTLTGQAAALEYGRELVAEAGSFAFTGQDASLIYSAAGKLLVADAGSFTFTGQDATLTYAAEEEEVEVYVPRGQGLVKRRRGRKRLLPHEMEAFDAEEAEKKRKAKEAKEPTKKVKAEENIKGALFPRKDGKVGKQVEYPELIPITIDVGLLEQEIQLRKEEEELMIVLALVA